ncbi:MAG: glycerophosphoryl diester phosphodiesterase membrane domain-containing protein [Microgenomates group bacterium]
MEQNEIKSPIQYIKEAWGIYTKKENFIFFAKIMAVLVLVTTTIGFVTGYFYPEEYLKNGDFSNTPILVGFVVLSLVAIVTGLWTQTTTTLAVIKMNSNEKEIFKFGFRYSWKFFVASFIVGFFTVLGILLFVFAVWYSFAPMLVIDKNYKVSKALAESREMVRGKFWKILGRFVVFGLFSIIVTVLLSIIPYAGSLAVSFVAPLFLLPMYLLYKDLSASRGL